MYCSKCGVQLADDSNFCDHCGTRTRANDEKAANVEVAEVKDPVKTATAQHPSSISILIWGIAGLCCSIEVGILGIILSFIGNKKYSEYISSGAPINKKVNIGGTLSKIGIIVGIVTTVFSVLSLLYIVIALIFAIVQGISSLAQIFTYMDSFMDYMKVFYEQYNQYMINM